MPEVSDSHGILLCMLVELITALLLQYKYALITPAVFIFGAPVGLVAGFLLRLDVLEIVPTCLALAAGELGSDVLWYWIGHQYGDRFVKRFGRYFGITPTSVAYAIGLYRKHHDIIIFTSKITAGFGFATLVLFTAGLSRVSFRKYMVLNITGQFLWTAGLLSVGYFLGHVLVDISNIFENMALIGLITILLVSVVGLIKYLRSYFTSV